MWKEESRAEDIQGEFPCEAGNKTIDNHFGEGGLIMWQKFYSRQLAKDKRLRYNYFLLTG